jgi:hypothetical protein
LNECELREILGDDKPTIAAGDFNAKHVDWFCRTTNQNGRVRQNFASNKEVVIVTPPQPTFYDYRLDGRPDILYIALAENVTHQIRSGSNASESLSHRTWKTTQSGKWSNYCGTTESPPIHGTRGMVYTDEEKAERLLSLELQCRANFPNADLDHVEEVEKQVEQIADEEPETPIPPTSPPRSPTAHPRS